MGVACKVQLRVTGSPDGCSSGVVDKLSVEISPRRGEERRGEGELTNGTH